MSFPKIISQLKRGCERCEHDLREADCKHRELDGNSKFCLLLKLSWFKALNKRRKLVKK